jgi:hypothetical protein
VGGAWFFIVLSLVRVSWAITVMWDDPTSRIRLHYTVVGDVSYDAWGLTYTGIVGLLLAIVQLLVITIAAIASTLRSDRTLKARRVGHLVLCGWSALWALNLIGSVAINVQLNAIVEATLLSVLLGCTVFRASRGWSTAGTLDAAVP